MWVYGEIVFRPIKINIFVKPWSSLLGWTGIGIDVSWLLSWTGIGISGVDRWISCVVESDVEEMIFKFKRSDFIEYYSLPHSVFVAKSLTVLTLHMCKFESTCGDVTISSSSLKKLSSTNVYADDQIIQNLLHGCPAMEYISFASCFRIKSIKFIGLPKVMEIKVQNN